MRIALLSALADPSASAGERPAFRRFAGKSVLAHQIDCVALLGCTRVVCISPTTGPDLATAKSYAERQGLKFDSVKDLLRLTAQVTADDEVVFLSDGLLPDRENLVSALAARPGVLAFPDDPAVSQGYERLDATRAWSGALRARGDSVARLADMPDDCDVGSTLLRIALQSGTRVLELDPALLADQAWQRRVDRQVAQASEWRWITRQVSPAPFIAPGTALTERMALRWSRDAGGGRWARTPHLAAALALLGSLGAWFGGRPVIGLGLVLLAFAALMVASVFDRVEILGAPRRHPPRLLPAGRWFCDATLILLLSSLLLVVPWWLGSVLAVTLVGLLRLGEETAPKRWRPLFADRIAMLIVLAPMTYLGWGTAATAALLIVALGGLLVSAIAYAPELTAD